MANEDINRVADWWADGRRMGAAVDVRSFKSVTDLLPGDLVMEVEHVSGRVYVARLHERETYVLHNTHTGEVFDASAPTEAQAWQLFETYDLGDDNRKHYEVTTRAAAQALSRRGGAITHGPDALNRRAIADGYYREMTKGAKSNG